jgi:hypothetical protein
MATKGAPNHRLGAHYRPAFACVQLTAHERHFEGIQKPRWNAGGPVPDTAAAKQWAM